jgi:hypothetical protein
VKHLLAARAHGKCEACGCFLGDRGELDHFFGRAKAEELESTCWLICSECHYSKTRNHPNAAHWLSLFIAHCVRWGYHESRQRAEARRDFVNAKARSAVPP